MLNLRNRSFTKGGRPIELTQVEFQIVEYFISNAGKALKRSDILKHVWGSGYVGEEKIVKIYENPVVFRGVSKENPENADMTIYEISTFEN